MKALQLLDVFADHLSGKAVITPKWIENERASQLGSAELQAIIEQTHALLSKDRTSGREHPDVLPLRGVVGAHEYRVDRLGVVVRGVEYYDIDTDTLRFRLESVRF